MRIMLPTRAKAVFPTKMILKIEFIYKPEMNDDLGIPPLPLASFSIRKIVFRGDLSSHFSVTKSKIDITSVKPLHEEYLDKSLVVMDKKTCVSLAGDVFHDRCDNPFHPKAQLSILPLSHIDWLIATFAFSVLTGDQIVFLRETLPAILDDDVSYSY